MQSAISMPTSVTFYVIKQRDIVAINYIWVLSPGQEFVKHMEGENLPIIQVKDETSQKQVMKNKAAIKSIPLTVYFFAKQGLPLEATEMILNIWERV